MLDEKLHDLVASTVESKNCILWGMEYLPRGASGLLRVYIDKNGEEIGVNDCVSVSNQLNLVLFAEQETPRKYTLEVSSPGLDRKFFSVEQMLPYEGEKITVNLFKAVENRKKLKGELVGVKIEQNLIEMNVENNKIKLPFSSIQQVRLHVDI